jgi:hypothetical protein
VRPLQGQRLRTAEQLEGVARLSDVSWSRQGRDRRTTARHAMIAGFFEKTASRFQPVLCCRTCREVYAVFRERPAITLDEVLAMHYEMEHE